MKTTSKQSFKDLLTSLGIKTYLNKEVVTEVEPCEPQDIEFFKPEGYITCEELDAEYASRGLEPAHPYALALYAKEHPDFADEKWVGTQWKDAEGFCCAYFLRWYGERLVSIFRFDDGWRDHWFFAGVRKSGTVSSDTQPLHSETWPLNELKINGIKYKKI